MSFPDYVDIPPTATRLKSNPPTIVTSTSTHIRHKSVPTLPSSISSPPPTPTRLSLSILPTLLLSSSAHIPTSPSTPRAAPTAAAPLLSARDPLSLPITTANFKRFVSVCAPIFWLQDRVEEIVMWRCGYRVTALWMAAYAFLCYFPRLIFLLPHALLIGVLLATHPVRTRGGGNNRNAKDDAHQPPPPATAHEGTVDWQANLQAIQNLMGAVADAHDAILPFLPHLTNASPYSTPLLAFALASFPLFLSLLLLPLPFARPAALTAGFVPLLLTHPHVRTRFPEAWRLARRAYSKLVLRAMDNDALSDEVWAASLREVELWENERWTGPGGSASTAGAAECTWGKGALRTGERAGWTRGRDGSGADVSKLIFPLDSDPGPGWEFVPTEDWRADVDAAWAGCGGDDDGWVYTNDAWLDARAASLPEWARTGMTRRRRWVRRIYYTGRAGFKV